MTEFDRFVDFLRREAVSYHEPPEVPSDEIWEGIEATVTEIGPSSIDRGIGSDALGAVHYNEPPATPKEAMWTRIEGSWTLRQAAPVPVREVGLDVLEPVEIEETGPRERRSVAMWITGVAVAASLVLGVFLGRGWLSVGGGPQIASAPDRGDPTPTVAIADPETDILSPNADLLVDEPLETSRQLAADVTPQPEPTGPNVREARVTPPVLVDDRAERRAVAAQYATSEHMGHAVTLLTAFRTDESAPEAERELARWARQLLGDTRLLLDMDAQRSPQQRMLLQDLELTLAQIARLGPGAADFERELIQEGIEHQATLTRLHAATQVGT